MLLLRMVSGSRLYGTNHAGSDWDWYEIVDQGKPFHSAHGPDGDITRWPLSKFMMIANMGGHNALDLMFAPDGWAEVDLLSDFRRGYRANPVACWHRFHGTIRNLRNIGTEKSLRHADRLSDNLVSIMETGRYDPVWKTPTRG